MIVSYLTLRKALGWIAIGMPIVVRAVAYYFDRIPLAGSISAYYYTTGRDEFVGALCAIGVFLFFYRGYDKVDDFLTNVAGVAAVLIGLLPMDPTYSSVIEAQFPAMKNGGAGCYQNHGLLGFHIYAVTVFFAIISYQVIFKFTKCRYPNPGVQKLQRNKVYVTCGIIMLVSFATIPVLKLLSKDASIFWPETTAIVAFAVAWLTKGQQILKD